MIVEFLGVPGSGKSTLARPFAEALRKRGYRTVLPLNDDAAVGPRLLDFGRRILFIMLLFCRAPRQCLRVMAASRGVQPNLLSYLRHCQGLLYICALHYQYRRRQDIAILDQGFAQAVYSLALRRAVPLPASAEGIESLSVVLGVLPKPDVLIKLDVPLETLRARLNCRWQQVGRRMWPHSRLELLSRTDNRSVEDSMRLIRCIEEVSKCQGWNIVRHFAEAGSIAEVGERLAQEVLSYARAAAACTTEP